MLRMILRTSRRLPASRKKEVHEDFISWEATSEEETAEVPEDEDSAEDPAEKGFRRRFSGR